MKFLVQFRCVSPEPTDPVETVEREVEAPTFTIAAERGERQIREEGEWQLVQFTGKWKCYDEEDF